MIFSYFELVDFEEKDGFARRLPVRLTGRFGPDPAAVSALLNVR